jgi:hypothetical protein
MTSYFERQGARPCNADENPAEWMLEITGSTADSEGQQDWSEIWKDSPERQAMKRKLSHLKERFSGRLDLGSSLSTSDTVQESATALDAIELQRELELSFVISFLGIFNTSPGTFYKYLFLENIQVPLHSPKSDACRCWLTNNASVRRPAYLL